MNNAQLKLLVSCSLEKREIAVTRPLRLLLCSRPSPSSFSSSEIDKQDKYYEDKPEETW